MGDFRAPHLYSQYARLLRKVDRGQALWDPSPDVIANGDERNPDPVVEIGHLGYEEGGKWHHILDVHRSQQEQHTPGHIPASLFEQIPRPLISSSEPVGPHHFTPHSSTELKLDTTGTTANATATGPTLALKLTHNASLTSFGRSQRDQVRRLELGNYKAYALRNLHYWEHIIRKNDWSISVHKFGIVVDRTLASSWAVTVKTEQSLDATLGAQIAICGTANGDLMLSFSHTSSAGLLSNYGPYSRLRALPPQSDLTSEKFFPSDDSPAISGPLDQCLFVKCITVADLAWYRRLQASIQALFPSENMISRSKASPSIHSQSLSYSDFTTYLSGERIAGDNLPYEAFKIPRDTGDLLPELHGLTDLSTAVLRYVFQQSNVERAVFHDDDILPYMKDISEKESWLTALSRICPRIYKYQYDDCTVGSLSELNFGTPIRKPGSFSHVPWNNFHALLIGIDKYKTYDDLDGAVRDVQAMEEFITGAFDVPSGFKLDITTLVNEQATSTNIVDAIARLKLNKKIKQNDTILIHYVGHGATMPPPEGWPGWTSIPPEDGYPPDVEIQCVVAHDAEVSADSSGLYFAKGVVPDRTLNVLLRDLADAKGNNITVILDCCHSGSGTRNPRASRERAVQLRDPFDKRVTISGRHHREIWGPFFARGAVLDWQYRHAGLGSHVLLAACGKKEVASDGSSFTQAIVAYCRKVYLDELSYTTLIDGIGKLGSRLSPQNPLCEGNNVKSILFDLKDTHLGRLTFDVTMDKQKPVLNAGAMLGITKGMVFDVFTSKVISLREELIGKFTVTRVGATSSTLEGPGGVKADISTAVASPSAAMSDVFPVCAPDPALCETVRLAVQKEPQEDQYGRPSISVEANYLMGEPDITVDHDMQNGIYFAHQLSSNAGRYGLKRLQFALPATLADPEPVRRVLRAAAHFFHHLRTTPINTGVLLGSLIEVRLHELEETREIALVHGRLTRVLNPTRQIQPREDGAYEVHAARADEDADTATRYGLELVNGRLQHGLFAWMFFFDCSTLQILPYHEPRVAKGSSAVDPTLPPMEDDEEPIPVALNYRDGAGKVLRLQLYEKQELDVGFLRIYLSTKYHGGALSGIVQNPPLMLDQGVWRGSKERGGFRGPTPPTQPGRSAGDSVPDLWDVITIPLIQRAKQEKGDL